MPVNDSPAILVARFLKANHYDETLDVFLREAGLPLDSANTNKNDITLEKVLEEKKTFDLSVQFEKLGTGEDDKEWNTHAPAVQNVVSGLPSSSNILHVAFGLHSDGENRLKQHLLATSADRRLNIIGLPSTVLTTSLTTLHDSPILSCVSLKDGVLLSTSMSGQTVLSDHQGQVLYKRRDHAKYVVQASVDQGADTSWVATAGWDAQVHLYKLDTASQKLESPSATISLPTNPESLLFVKHPETNESILILTRRDSTFLYYYSVSSDPQLLGRQNLAPHSNAWIAFTPSAIALSPTDPTLLAIATSAVPHMKLIIVRLMLPCSTSPATETLQPLPNTIVRSSLLDDAADPTQPTQASQARAALALQDKEAAAILIHCTTLSPQTPYSTPALAWRPDGSGVWVNSDDGAVRGIEARSGKIVSTLKGHEPGSKIRCLCAGMVEGEDGVMEEWLVSGGFDQQLIVWRPEG